MLILLQTLKNMRKVLHTRVEESRGFCGTQWGNLQVKINPVVSSEEIFLSMNCRILRLGKTFAEPSRPMEGIANSIEQRKAVYRDGRYQIHIKRNPEKPRTQRRAALGKQVKARLGPIYGMVPASAVQGRVQGGTRI